MAAPSPIGYWLKGIEPKEDPAWHLIGSAGREEFWRFAARVGVAVKELELAAGLDRYGNTMRPVHRLTRQARKADINPVTARNPYSPMGRANEGAPPLTPAGAASRVRSLLRAKVYPGQGVWFYWSVDPHTGLDWGIVLRRHARGFTQRFRWPKPSFGHVPARDVIGLSPQAMARIELEMRNWWTSNRPRLTFMALPMPNIRERARRRTTVYGFVREKVDLSKTTFHTGTREAVESTIAAGRYFSGFGTFRPTKGGGNSPIRGRITPRVGPSGNHK